jgi:glutamate-ammonia-ligase adenylyltransferase
LPFRLAVIALGRLGGSEMGYSSDADVVFVHEALPGADEDDVSLLAREVAYETKRLLAQPGPDLPLAIDAGLRPEGRQGPITRSLDGYLAYYARWSSVWEAQALLRAAPVAGDVALAQRFLTEVADVARFPVAFGEDQVREVRRLKARMEAERVSLARRYRDIKLGPGGLSDIEWTVQLLQLRHGHAVPSLRVTGTLTALAAATAEGLIEPADAEVLRRGWWLLSRVRNAVTLVTGKPSDLAPAAATSTLASVAHLLGYPPEEPAALLEEVMARARRSRAVAQRRFYDDAEDSR